MPNRIKKILLWTGVLALVLSGGGAVMWWRTFRHYAPKEVMKDVRAGVAARHIQDPQERIHVFLQARYGPLTEPANRERAFLDFFDVDHIQGLNFIVNHSPPDQKKANTQAMADWIAQYRITMSAQEKTDLQAQLDSEPGRAMLRRATAQYQSQDVYYRGNQKPVIAELMTTLTALKK